MNRLVSCGNGQSSRSLVIKRITDWSRSYHGAWLAPNIYFLGFAGCLLIDGWLRIAGASGIWKSGDWKKGEHNLLLEMSTTEISTGHFETVPYDDRTIRSVYHIREYDVARLLQVGDS